MKANVSGTLELLPQETECCSGPQPNLSMQLETSKQKLLPGTVPETLLPQIKQQSRRSGIYLIRNTINDRIYVGHMLGKVHSNESKRKISAAVKLYWRNKKQVTHTGELYA